MATKQFHFMLSPVQSFISQARRTRDFWAGSFLLSWLSAVAMQAVLKQNASNSVVFPLRDENFLNWLEGNKTEEKPEHGTVVAVGPGRRGDDNDLVPMGVQVGDKVMFSKYGFDEIKVGGIEYYILPESSILAVIHN